MTVYCRKRLNFARSGYGKVLAPAFPFAFNCSAVSGGCHSVFSTEVAHEVSIRSNTDLLQNLLDTKKRGAQHFFRLAQTQVFEILGRTRSSFLFKEMTEARR